MTLHPKKVMVSEYDPGKTLVVGVAQILDKPGALSEVLKMLAGKGVQLRFTNSYSSEGGKAVLSFMAEAQGSDAKSLNRALEANRWVVESRVHEAASGFVSDTLQFPIIAGEDRVVLLRASAVTKMFSDLLNLYGSGGQVLLYQEGWALGADRARAQMKTLPEERLRGLEPELLGVWSAIGWGAVQVIEKDRNLSRIVLRIKDNFEVSGVSSKGPHCWFVRGAMAGYVSEIAGKTLSCMEEKCAAAGSPYCEFVLVSERVTTPTVSSPGKAAVFSPLMVIVP